MKSPNWFRLFPDQDFRWSMALQPGDARDFFTESADGTASLALRSSALQEHPNRYAALPDSESDVIHEALEQMSAWTGRSFFDPWEAGALLEPDWAILRPDATGAFRVVAGVVCFPSTWSLPEKLGLPIASVHEPVAGLNQSLARQIDTFLARLAVGDEWERENWGLSADPELDHHPRRERLSLTTTATLDTTWLRLERQLFARLQGGGLLFGIRVSVHRLDQLCELHLGLAIRIARALETMPEPIAGYKGLSEARLPLASLLRQNEKHTRRDSNPKPDKESELLG